MRRNRFGSAESRGEGFSRNIQVRFRIVDLTLPEELPTTRRRVLVSDGTRVVEAHRNSKNGKWEGFYITDDYVMGDITHWAELPKAP